jgi:serine/threonine-protein kinase
MPNDRTEYPGVVPSADAPSTTIAAGDVIADKFRVERLIDEGGMGLVVEATHLGLDERVALKFLRREILGRQEFVARFAREARAAVKLKSEHVARVSDVGVDKARGPFMVMEYLEGQDLRDLLRRCGRVPNAEAVEYIIQACEAVAEAHARGIVHRDIKPENLFLVERSKAWRIIKVLDFGISKLRGALGDMEVVTAPLMGSPCYMSPEQLRSTKDVDHRADIWSLGAVLFELLSGTPPFDPTRSLPEIVASVLEEPVPPLAEYAPWVPEGLVAVVERSLEKDVAKRYQSAAELALDLLPYAPRRARVPVERALSISRGAGMLSDPTVALPPSMAPGPITDPGAAPPMTPISPARLPRVAAPAALQDEVITEPASTTDVAPPPTPSLSVGGQTPQHPPSETRLDSLRSPSLGPNLAHAKTMRAPGARRIEPRWFAAGGAALLVMIGLVWLTRDPATATAQAALGIAPAILARSQTAAATAPAPPPPPQAEAEADTPSTVGGKPSKGRPAVPSKKGATPKPSATPTAAPATGPDLDIRRTR